MRTKDITGQKFNHLTAIRFDHSKREPNGKLCQYWLFKCDCGKEKVIKKASVTSGQQKACGCLVKFNSYAGRKVLKGIKKVDFVHTRLTFVLNGMIQRCYNKNNPKYKNYGARGIKVCDLWLKDYGTFYNWAVEHGYEQGLTIDRIDVNGDYCPENCRWATMKTQQRNRTNNRRITFNGKCMCTTEWDDYLGFPNGTVKDRLQRGYTEEDALITPFGVVRHSLLGIGNRNGRGGPEKYITHNGLTLSYKDWEQRLGMRRCTISRRIHKGLTEIEALTTPYIRYKKA